MKKDSKILIFGDTGLVGSNLKKYLINNNYSNVFGVSSSTANLCNYEETENVYKIFRPEYVFMCAAKVGGIIANNSQPVDFISINTLINYNTITLAYKYNVTKFIFLGSSCIYPNNIEMPIKETDLLSGYLEPTNEAYAISKIFGIKLCESYNKQYNINTFISVMPTNLYGPGDNYNLNTSHVLPALIRKIHDAKINNESEVILHGDGTPIREFLYVEDLSYILESIMNNISNKNIINIGAGVENIVSIKELANIIKNIIKYEGKIIFNNDNLNGTKVKILDNSILNEFNIKHKTNLFDGIIKTYKNYLENYYECTRY